MFLTIKIFGQFRHLTVKVPESIVAIACILPVRSRLCAAELLREACCTHFSLRFLCTRTPTFDKPAFTGIQFLQDSRFIPIHIRGNPMFYRFLQEKTDIIGCTVGHIKISSSGITKKRYTTFGIHHTKSQSRISARFPPFILSFNHQTGNTVDVARTSPFQIGTAVACQVSTRSIAVVRNNR